MGIKNLLEISNYYELLDKYSFNFKKQSLFLSLVLNYIIMTKNINDEIFMLLASYVNNLDDNYPNIMHTKVYLDGIDIILDKLYKGKNEEEITRNIIKNYFEDGYVFHTFNIGIYENVLRKGLSLTPDIFPNDKIIAIKEIFKSKNKGVFGLYNPTDNKVFFASSPINIYQYGAGSPSFFRKLIFMNDKKDSYINRDYERCLISIKNTIKEYNLSNVEGELVLSLFNELYSLFSRNDYIIALKKKKKNIKIEDYSQNNLRNIIKQDMSVDYRFYENINSNDLEFILVRNHSNTIKRSRT